MLRVVGSIGLAIREAQNKVSPTPIQAPRVIRKKLIVKVRISIVPNYLGRS
jgi:hypothetical protein